MYVDYCLTGGESVEATLGLQKSLDEMMKRGGFKLTKWVSNSKGVLSHIAKENQTQSNTINFNESEPLKALGICWNTITDCFCSAFHRACSRWMTLKRCNSRCPMGQLTPFTVRAKILFQDLWQRGLEWEDRLDEDVAVQWRSVTSWQTSDQVELSNCTGLVTLHRKLMA